MAVPLEREGFFLKDSKRTENEEDFPNPLLSRESIVSPFVRGLAFQLSGTLQLKLI
jgi:hypothetical protein